MCIFEKEDRFKYIEDLRALQLVGLPGLLTEYGFKEHVALMLVWDRLSSRC